MSVNELKSLSGGSGVHVFLVLWKAARAVEAYAQKSVSGLDICGSDVAVLEALLHNGPLPAKEIGRKARWPASSTASRRWKAQGFSCADHSRRRRSRSSTRSCSLTRWGP